MTGELPVGGAEAPPTRRQWLALAVLATGLGLIVLDGTIVGVALPDIIRDIHLDLTDAQWVNSLYAVVLAALLLATGRLADRWGRKRLFLAGLVVFVAGSILAAAAHSAQPLIVARAVQAVGAALIMPSTLSTVNATFRGRYRAAAFGVWGAVISGAAAVGPLAGGALTQWASWHWIFLVNTPLGAIVLLAALATVDETRGRIDRPGADVDGALLSGIGFGALVFAVIEGPDLGWWRPKADFTVFGWTWRAGGSVSIVPVLLAIAVVALTLFVVWERHREKVRRSALLDLKLFRLATFSWGNTTAAMVAVGEFAVLFVLPLYLVNALGLDVMQAGLVLAAMAVGAFGSGATARQVAGRLGSPATVVLGLALEVGSVLVLALVVRGSTPGWVVACPLVVYGLGLGLASAQLTGTVLRDVPVDQSGQGSATQSTLRQFGSALGTAFAGAALSMALTLTLPPALHSAGVTGGSADSVARATRESAGTTIAQLRAQGTAGPLGPHTQAAVDALASGFADATRWALVVAAAFLVLGLGGAGRLRTRSGPPVAPAGAAPDRESAGEGALS
ncbi:MAG: MFS transporter [Jatrophihabitans sp.]|nr:MAG: MFS transporter [Jatrophihabitans sp.]